jgi:hypothetical protein
MSETLLSTSNILLFGREVTDLLIAGSDKHAESCKDDGDGQNGDGQNGDGDGGSGDGGRGQDIASLGHNPSPGARKGKPHWLWQQLEHKEARLARIYGFSYEGTYYDLPCPALFLVHGTGERAVLNSNIVGQSQTDAQLARAPQKPNLSGVAAADFGIADDIRVWSYDKADYTIRMDVETGMFEQVLLDAYFSDGGHVSGMKVSGMKVSGMKVAGMKVAGMKVAGSRLGRGDAGD